MTADAAEQDSPEVQLPLPDRLLEDLGKEQQRAAIDDALRRLPEHQRVPLVLYHFEDLSYQEIAERLRVSLAKVKTDIRRARAAMLPMLQVRRPSPAANGETEPLMSEPFDEEQGLERLLDRTLRELPLRRAPPSLEARVLRRVAAARGAALVAPQLRVLAAARARRLRGRRAWRWSGWRSWKAPGPSRA